MDSLNKGGDVTKGLRKVDKSEMTHKNPSLRESSVVPAKAASPVTAPPKVGSCPLFTAIYLSPFLTFIISCFIRRFVHSLLIMVVIVTFSCSLIKHYRNITLFSIQIQLSHSLITLSLSHSLALSFTLSLSLSAPLPGLRQDCRSEPPQQTGAGWKEMGCGVLQGSS